MKAVFVACEDKDCESIISQGLANSKYSIVQMARIDADIYAGLKSSNADTLVLQVEVPHSDLLQSLKLINENFAIPIVLFATEARSFMVEEVVNAGVSAFVIDGLSQNRIRPILDTAIARFNSIKTMRDELRKIKLTLDERKYIDRAKGLLIKQKNITEDEAYRMLRKMAMENNKRIGQAAKDVINVMEVLA